LHKIFASAVKRVEFISDMGLHRPVVLRSRCVRASMRKNGRYDMCERTASMRNDSR